MSSWTGASLGNFLCWSMATFTSATEWPRRQILVEKHFHFSVWFVSIWVIFMTKNIIGIWNIRTALLDQTKSTFILAFRFPLHSAEYCQKPTTKAHKVMATLWYASSWLSFIVNWWCFPSGVYQYVFMYVPHASYLGFQVHMCVQEDFPKCFGFFQLGVYGELWIPLFSLAKPGTLSRMFKNGAFVGSNIFKLDM